VNDDLERCVGDVAAIIRAERLRRARRSGVIAPIITTFQE
jgi:guanylate kinase